MRRNLKPEYRGHMWLPRLSGVCGLLFPLNTNLDEESRSQMKSPSQCPTDLTKGPEGTCASKRNRQNHAVQRGRTEFNPQKGLIPIIKNIIIKRIFCPLESPLLPCRREETGNWAECRMEEQTVTQWISLNYSENSTCVNEAPKGQ